MSTMQVIKKLRAASGARMVDCKAAVEATATLDEAFEWLRKKGVARAAKLSDREAAHGLVAVALGDGAGVVVELNSETDFVARNAEFSKFAADLAAAALEHRDALGAAPCPATGALIVEAPALAELKLAGGVDVAAAAAALSAHVGERVVARRAKFVTGAVVGGYAHAAVAPGAGLAAALIALEDVGGGSADAVAAAAHAAAMHAVAAKPAYLSGDRVPEALLAAERAVLSDQLTDSGKPENIVEKIVAARLAKFANERSLLSQAHLVAGGKTTVEAVLDAASPGLKCTAFALAGIGEE